MIKYTLEDIQACDNIPQLIKINNDILKNIREEETKNPTPHNIIGRHGGEMRILAEIGIQIQKVKKESNGKVNLTYRRN